MEFNCKLGMVSSAKSWFAKWMIIFLHWVVFIHSVEKAKCVNSVPRAAKVSRLWFTFLWMSNKVICSDIRRIIELFLFNRPLHTLSDKLNSALNLWLSTWGSKNPETFNKLVEERVNIFWKSWFLVIYHLIFYEIHYDASTHELLFFPWK